MEIHVRQWEFEIWWNIYGHCTIALRSSYHCLVNKCYLHGCRVNGPLPTRLPGEQMLIYPVSTCYKHFFDPATVYNKPYTTCSRVNILKSDSRRPKKKISHTVFYPVPNRIYVRVRCHLYECIWLYFLSIEELTNYSCTKHWKAFYRSAFSFIAGLHNVGLPLTPISEQYYPVSNRVI